MVFIECVYVNVLQDIIITFLSIGEVTVIVDCIFGNIFGYNRKVKSGKVILFLVLL
jgi:hypothetical protein